MSIDARRSWFDPELDALYPSSDGEPIAENTIQFRWIETIKGGLEALYRDDPDVFVAGDLFWYPVEGDPATRTAPDALVALGRPKGERGSYMQWLEGGIAPQVVFEVLSPSNRAGEMRDKLAFYERFGVEEYYLFDPEKIVLKGWRRQGEALRPIRRMDGWTSPLLGIRFELGEDLTIFRPGGEPFESYVGLFTSREEARREAEEAGRRADEDRRRAEEADLRAEEAERRAAEDRRKAEALARRLRELGFDPDEGPDRP